MTKTTKTVRTKVPPASKSDQKRRGALGRVGSDILVVALIDASGSMAFQRDSVISGFNEYLTGLAKDTETRYEVALTFFNAGNRNEIVYVSRSATALADFSPITREDYDPAGGTPLNDAIAEVIEQNMYVRHKPVLCLIMTDGEENASIRYPRPHGVTTVRAMVKQRESENWTFLYLGANLEAQQSATDLGLTLNSTTYRSGATGQSLNYMSTVTANYAAQRRQTGAMGSSTSSFSAEDTSNLSSGTGLGKKPEKKP